MRPLGIPAAVREGMYVAALARAERCDVYADQGALELYLSHGPSTELRAAFARERHKVAGALGFAIPVRPASRRGLLTFCSWPRTMAFTIGAMGDN